MRGTHTRSEARRRAGLHVEQPNDESAGRSERIGLRRRSTDPGAWAELLEASALLRAAHPDLAARVTRLKLEAGEESTAKALASLREVRIELYRRSALESETLALDFDQAN